MISKEEFINNAKNYLNYHYLYGYKGQVINESLNKELSSLYPSIWGQSIYKTNSKKWLGDSAIDCSGLVCRAMGWPIGKDLGSYQMEERWAKAPSSSSSEGVILWRPGHVAIALNDKQLIEASGIRVGVRIRDYNNTEFKKFLYAPDVDYNSSNYTGWRWDNDKKGWQYLINNEPIKEGIHLLDSKKGKFNFIFYNYYCFITDDYGVIKEPKL